MGKELPGEYYNDVYSNKNSLYNREPRELRYYYPNWIKCIEYIIDNDLKSIIDLGCGPGHFSRLLKEEDNIKYTGIDFSDVAINIARSRNKNPNNDYVVKDLRQFERPPGNHIFTCHEFLEHVTFDIELISSLSSNDQILFSVPSYDSPGHVRAFETTDVVIQRYGGLLDLELLRRTTTRTKKRKTIGYIYLYKGIKR